MPDKKKKIFLIEDDAAIADVYAIMMKKSHFEVEVFSLGQEAIKKIKEVSANENGDQQKPDVVLLDLILPDMNGVQVLQEMKSNPATKDIKVFIMSNQAEEELAKKGVKPDRFIIKANTTPTQLIEIINENIK